MVEHKITYKASSYIPTCIHREIKALSGPQFVNHVHCNTLHSLCLIWREFWHCPASYSLNHLLSSSLSLSTLFLFLQSPNFDAHSQLIVPHLTSLRKLGSVLLTTCLPSSLALTCVLSSEWIIDALKLTATFCSILSPSPTADTPHWSTLCLNWLSHSLSWIIALVLSSSPCCCCPPPPPIPL